VFRFAVLGSLLLVPFAYASGDLVLFVGSGAARQPIARFDGERWTATCTAVAGATAAALQPVRRIAAGSAEWNAVQPVVTAIFSRREREQRVAVARLATAPMTIEAAYASGAAAKATYYFEATRRVESTSGDADPDTDPAGVLTVRVVGWLRVVGGRVTPIGSNASVEWEQLDRVAAAAAGDAVPIGALSQGDAIVWVMKRDTGVAPTFTLYEMRAESVRPLVRSSC
jgi:hypothetical protein